ncbi:Plasmodium exported protein, unknown function [Plasmodium chabaudi chabaudi]|uniref:Plasmodium RESA N-terminal domain-containing protein n=1 Tax=Plasmodium chabaudi chabaudi TaxID=31271 RepID=A0A4V0K5U8_PLACU|nr:Plasmodium exported protein, unknown function [Plasmodium chabaudi chabaudi]VTZ67843.1 Plasmodium exported protein, unknown function [Plasmodium chabaudi chabaudi]|eukprot:XP_738422.2 Plasmodium exported protein, unknown function [Plasmodium chabaudi chabaudi]
MIAVILNLAIFTFLQCSTNYQPGISHKSATTSGINYYHNLVHTNNVYQHIKQNGGRFKRILRGLPQRSDEVLRNVSLQVEDQLGDISPEVLALYPLLPNHDDNTSFLIVNDLNDEEETTQGQNNYESILIEFLMDAAQSTPAADTNNTNTSSAETNLSELPASSESPNSSEDDLILERLNLIYRMDGLWEACVNNMFAQYNELADSLQLIPESRLVIWNETWRTHLESMLNTVVTLFENYNMSISEIEDQVIGIVERAKLDFQVFLTSTRDAVLQALATSDANQPIQTQ